MIGQPGGVERRRRFGAGALLCAALAGLIAIGGCSAAAATSTSRSGTLSVAVSVPGSQSTRSAAPASSSTSPQPDTSPPAGEIETTLVGTPDHHIKVALNATVLLRDGHTLICPPAAVLDSAGMDAPDCIGGIAATGVNTGPLTQTNGDLLWGYRHLVGRFDSHTLAVDEQGPVPRADQTFVDNVPCPAPAGGWKPNGTRGNIDAIRKAVSNWIGGRAAAYFGPQAPRDAVMVIGVVSDIAQAEQDLRTVYSGNLCVVHADQTEVQASRQGKAVAAKLRPLMNPQGVVLGIVNTTGATEPLGNPRITVDVIYTTQQLLDLINSVPGPAVVVRPWLTPTA